MSGHLKYKLGLRFMKGVSIQEADLHAIESHYGRCKQFWSLSHFIMNSKPGYLSPCRIDFEHSF